VRRSPFACAGAFVCGATDSVFIVLAPVHASRLGASPQAAVLLIAVAAAAAMLAQIPLSRWSDQRVRRRQMMSAAAGASLFAMDEEGRVARLVPIVATSIAAMVLAVVLTVWPAGFTIVFVGLIAIYAAATSPLYALSGAMAYEGVETVRFACIAGAMLLGHALGAVVGPPVLGVIMGLGAAGGPYAGLVVVHAALVIVGGAALILRARRLRRPA
jgi:MFS family permease